jgi:nitric oxide reductase NorD protein
MAEAEDVIVDVARHATVHARALWRRRARHTAPAAAFDLLEWLPRLELLAAAVFPLVLAWRAAAPPPPPTFLRRLRTRGMPVVRAALPATDGATVWVPDEVGSDDPAIATERLRVIALTQAARAARGAAARIAAQRDPLVAAVTAVLEADAADRVVVARLPGLAPAVLRFRRDAAASRPSPESLPRAARALERFVQATLADESVVEAAGARSAAAKQPGAASIALALRAEDPRIAPEALHLDRWLGAWRRPPPAAPDARSMPDDARSAPVSRSARLPRQPQVREAAPDERDSQPGAWMVQTTQPHEKAEDPGGLQRPGDRDVQTAAEEFADALSELPEASLVATPGTPPEVLLSDEPLATRARTAAEAAPTPEALAYPEWDHASATYLHPGAIVHVSRAAPGPEAWVERTLDTHRALLTSVRRQFEVLRARSARLRRQLDGDDIDLDAWANARADYAAGLPPEQRLYESRRTLDRELAVALLVDVSGSTDSWVTAHRRVIDVEREALLLVCVALDGLGEPYTVQAFSGEGPRGVDVREVKGFDERYGADVARRIAGLEPERYTRVGAAVRHATALLLRRAAKHRVLLLLSDGKPNDMDRYEGRHGLEDTRQAVVEARLQGVEPFCLTVDRQAGTYLPHLFGAGRYALLPRPERLPAALPEFLRRLIVSA